MGDFFTGLRVGAFCFALGFFGVLAAFGFWVTVVLGVDFLSLFFGAGVFVNFLAVGFSAGFSVARSVVSFISRVPLGISSCGSLILKGRGVDSVSFDGTGDASAVPEAEKEFEILVRFVMPPALWFFWPSSLAPRIRRTASISAPAAFFFIVFPFRKQPFTLPTLDKKIFSFYRHNRSLAVLLHYRSFAIMRFSNLLISLFNIS